MSAVFNRSRKSDRTRRWSSIHHYASEIVCHGESLTAPNCARTKDESARYIKISLVWRLNESDDSDETLLLSSVAMYTADTAVLRIRRCDLSNLMAVVSSFARYNLYIV